MRDQPISYMKEYAISSGFHAMRLCSVSARLEILNGKGLGLVLEALRGVSGISVHLIVIGGSRSEVREYEKIAERLGIANAVHFTGFEDDIRPYLWAADGFRLSIGV